MNLHGSWRVASATEPSVSAYGPHCFFFSPHGELVMSQDTGREPVRSLLTWAMSGGQIVIDQPSQPRADVMDVLFASETTFKLGASWYLREVEPSDPDARWWALLAGGGWYGVANAQSSGEPFVPFIVFETAAQRLQVRIVATSHDSAEQEARKYLATQPYERAVWVRDGRIPTAGGKRDAVLVACFEPGARLARGFALPYTFEGDRPSLVGESFVEVTP